MDKALGVTGQPISPRMGVALTLVITGEVIVQTNALRIVGSHLSHCKCPYMEKNSHTGPGILALISSISQVSRTPFVDEIKWKHTCFV